MSTMQIRNVPEQTRRVLKARAAAAGMSLSDYLLVEVNRLAERPTLDEVTARIARLGRAELPPAAEVLRRDRAERAADPVADRQARREAGREFA